MINLLQVLKNTINKVQNI